MVPAALALAGTPERGAHATVIALLIALSQDILPACSQPFQGPEAAAAASLAVDLIATAAQRTQVWPQLLHQNSAWLITHAPREALTNSILTR